MIIAPKPWPNPHLGPVIMIGALLCELAASKLQKYLRERIIRR